MIQDGFCSFCCTVPLGKCNSRAFRVMLAIEAQRLIRSQQPARRVLVYSRIVDPMLTYC